MSSAEAFAVGRPVERTVADEFVADLEELDASLDITIDSITGRQNPGVSYAPSGQLRQKGWRTTSGPAVETRQATVWGQIRRNPPLGLDIAQLDLPKTLDVNGVDFSLKKRHADGTGLVVATLRLLDGDDVLGSETDAFRNATGLSERRRPDDPEQANLIPARNLHLARLVIANVADVEFEPMREIMEEEFAPDQVTLLGVGVIQES